MLQRPSRDLMDRWSASDRSGLWTVEGLSLIALGALASRGLLPGLVRLDQFVGWIYIFAGGMRMFSGAVHRGPGLAWMISSAAISVAAGLVLVLQLAPSADSLAAVVAMQLCAEAFTVFGLSGKVGAWLNCRRWLSRAATADILLAAVAVLAAEGGASPVVTVLVVVLNLWLKGVTLVVLGYRWETVGPAELPATRPPRPPATSSRTYGHPWSRSWRS